MISLISTTTSFTKSQKPTGSGTGTMAGATSGPLSTGEVPAHVDPGQWLEAIGYARQVCARFFRDGATPSDAQKAFNLETSSAARSDWSRAVNSIAHALCTRSARRVA